MKSSPLTGLSRAISGLLPRPWLVLAAGGTALLLAAAPAQAGPLLKKEAVTYRQLGQQLQAAGQIDAAIDAYAKAVLSDPSSSSAHNDLGVMYEAKGWPANAEAEYLHALQLNPADGPAHMNLALLYEQQGRIGEAVPHWQRRVALGPSDDPWVQDAGERLTRHGAGVPAAGSITPEKTPKPKPVKAVPTPKPVAVPPVPKPAVVKPVPPPPAPVAAVAAPKPVVVPVKPVAAPKPVVSSKPAVPVKPVIVPAKPAGPSAADLRREQQTVLRQELARRKADAAARRQEAQALQRRQRLAQQQQANEAKRQREVLQRQQREAQRLAKEYMRQKAVQKPAAPKPVVVPVKPIAPAAPRPLVVSASSAPREGGAAKALERPSGHGVERSETSEGVRVAKPVSLGPTSVPERPALEAGRQQPVVPVTTAAQAKVLVDQITRERQRARDLMARELYQRGLILYRQQRYAPAIEQFQRALEIDPHHRESQQYLREAQMALARSSK